MDPATVIALCKENIQPLRYGRNAAQLGTALRAQEDTEVQQLLLQERQMYEDAIKNYEGDDPLETWYEYILWVEQSYPKSGHESHVGRLLQQCLAIFEKETKYHQDRRYIRLWINYISMQKNPLELYQLLHNNGIGTMVADMYRAWAFELEQIEDYKRADEVYLMGLSARAEPLDELEYAHKNFQLAVARKTLGRTDERCEMSVFEQRQAFSSLRAIRAGKKIGSVRTGHRVRDYYPGTVSQIVSVQNAKPNSRIQIYQDDGIETKGSSILDHVPVEDTIHKENTLKPGPWSSASKRCPLMTSCPKTSFKVHEDQEDCDMEKLKLFPNHTSFFDGSKYQEHLMVPVYVPDPPNPNVILKPHYPKELVYANNMDRSMEEIRAQPYLDRNQENKRQMQEILREQHKSQNSFEGNHQRHDVTLQELQRQEYERQELERERQRKMERERQRRETEQLELRRQQRVPIEQQELQRQEYEIENRTLENQRHEAEQREFERLEAERIEAERIEAERLEAQRMEAELNSQQKLQSPNFIGRIPPPNAEPEEHLLGQSLTMNTKEAMSVVQDLWHSLDATSTSPRFRSPVVPRMPHARTKLSFDIHMDSSMTQHAMSNGKPHQGYNMQPYNDQENHPTYARASYPGQEQQTPYGGHSLQNAYHYQMQQHHEQQMQQPHPRQHHEQQMQQPHPRQHHEQQMQQPHPRQHHEQQMQQSHPRQHHEQQMQQAHPRHHQQMMQSHHQSLSPPQHLQPHTQFQHHPAHAQPQHQSPHAQHHIQHQQHPAHPHMQHIQHTVYGNVMPNDMGFQQYPPSLESSMLQRNVEPQKEAAMRYITPYSEPDIESHKPYRMPSELPYIKSPGTNRRDLKYVESTEDKENAVVIDYNGPLEENMGLKPNEESNLYMGENLGMSPLPGSNDTCYTEAFNTELSSSTPMTNHFRPPYRAKDNTPQYLSQGVSAPQPVQEIPNGDIENKLSMILESTREYISSSSGSTTQRTTGLGFTITREDLVPIKEQSIDRNLQEESNDSLPPFLLHEQKLHPQVQAVHAQSPRTVQRNVDQITSEIQNNCDLRKSISFRLQEEPTEREKSDTMEYEEPMEQVQEEEEEPFQLPSGDINPFDKTLIAGLLRNIKFPRPQHAEGYVRIDTNLNKFVPSTTITLGNDTYDLEKCLGKGMYGTVFKGVKLQTGQTVALKMQKPAWVWEFYIVREIKSRLTNPHMLRGFMDVTMAYVANNSSVLVSEYSKYGTLLSVTNQIKFATGKPLVECLAIFFTIEMLQIVEYLHKCQIIHGDIKPDNFLLMRPPTEDVRPTIQLIDFGCSIDMTLLPEKTTFTQVIKTEDFTCIEMQTGRPWTYQTDLYCLAATSHCLLFGNYMRVTNNSGRWFISSKVPRYMKKAAWEQFFTELLNIESCEKMPDLSKLRNMMEEALAQQEVQSKIRSFVNILNNR